VRTHATFRSDRFEIPPDSGSLGTVPGADLAAWLARELRVWPTLSVGSPAQDDWAWRLPVAAGAQGAVLVMGLRSPCDAEWHLSAEPTVPVTPRFGGRIDQGAFESLVRLLDDVLRRDETIRDLGWHDTTAFRRGRSTPSPSPFDTPTETA
jgi:hypothetical protein